IPGRFSASRRCAPRNTPTSAPSTSHLMKSGATPKFRTKSSRDTASISMVSALAEFTTWPSPRSGDAFGSVRANKILRLADHTAFSSTVAQENPLRSTCSRSLDVFSDQAVGKERKESNVRANIIERHAGAKVLLQGILHVWFRGALQRIVAGARVQPQPNAGSRATLNLHPRERASRHNGCGSPAQASANDGNPAQAAERRRVSQKSLRQTIVGLRHAISPRGSCR